MPDHADSTCDFWPDGNHHPVALLFFYVQDPRTGGIVFYADARAALSALGGPPSTKTLPEWIILDDGPLTGSDQVFDGICVRGSGADRHGLIHSAGITAAPRNLVALPSVDDLV